MGFTDRDFGDTRPPHRARRHRSFTDPPLPVYRWVRRLTLSEAASIHPELVDDARTVLAGLLNRHATDHGLEVLEVNWASFDYADPHMVELELTAQLRPRLDGEWASIRAAIEEDQADRQEARLADGGVVRADEIDDRLDALRESVGVWTAKTPAEVREALSAPSPPARDPVLDDRDHS